ncbi:MAG: hypothetical protein JXR83_17695 [Deltaproteobacteria bacterium]|nr:hypothetical protein [Deltaproteobacteria bacterium]
MSTRCCIAIAIAVAVGLIACREAEQLPNPFTDASFVITGEDGGTIGQPCRQHAPACLDNGVAVAETDGGCVCRAPCQPSQAVPRCTGWEVCAALSQSLPDGGSRTLDAGVCLPAGAPNADCSPEQCAELLVCARLLGRDGGDTCRWPCDWTEDAGVEDATGRDLNAIPTPYTCPPGQDCFRMNSDGGACFLP